MRHMKENKNIRTANCRFKIIVMITSFPEHRFLSVPSNIKYTFLRLYWTLRRKQAIVISARFRCMTKDIVIIGLKQ
jgi:hypothetical protein